MAWRSERQDRRSLMNMANNKGPRMLPWGTLDNTGTKSDAELLMHTYWCLEVS